MNFIFQKNTPTSKNWRPNAKLEGVFVVVVVVFDIVNPSGHKVGGGNMEERSMKPLSVTRSQNYKPPQAPS